MEIGRLGHYGGRGRSDESGIDDQTVLRSHRAERLSWSLRVTATKRDGSTRRELTGLSRGDQSG